MKRQVEARGYPALARGPQCARKKASAWFREKHARHKPAPNRGRTFEGVPDRYQGHVSGRVRQAPNVGARFGRRFPNTCAVGTARVARRKDIAVRWFPVGRKLAKAPSAPRKIGKTGSARARRQTGSRARRVAGMFAPICARVKTQRRQVAPEHAPALRRPTRTARGVLAEAENSAGGHGLRAKRRLRVSQRADSQIAAA